MKQTAVEWFWDEIAEILPFTVDTETGMALYEAYQKAKEMESGQTISKMGTIRENGIVELSDEEIKEVADRFEQHEFYGAGRVFIKGAIWYREQLKQRQ